MASTAIAAPDDTASGTVVGNRRWAVFWAYVFLLLFVAFALCPPLYMLLTSLHSEPAAATNPPSFFAPLTLDGYANFFGAASGASPWPPLINSAFRVRYAAFDAEMISVARARRDRHHPDRPGRPNCPDPAGRDGRAGVGARPFGDG